MKAFVSYDPVDGRIISAEIGLPEMKTEAKKRLSQSGRKFVEHKSNVIPDTNRFYVKDGKVQERPELVPNSVGVVNLDSPDKLPTLPAGAMVTLDNFVLETMKKRGKPATIGKGSETVHVRIDAFPALPAFFNVANASRIAPEGPPRAGAPKPTKKGTKTKR
jgi:hypothetical protein